MENKILSFDNLRPLISKKYLLALFIAITYLFISYECDEKEAATKTVPYKAKSEIRLDGSFTDFVYSQTTYKDPGAEIMGVVNGELRCSGIFLKGTGPLNMSLPGTYVLHYDGVNYYGDSLPTVARTVQVIKHGTGF